MTGEEFIRHKVKIGIRTAKIRETLPQKVVVEGTVGLGILYLETARVGPDFRDDRTSDGRTTVEASERYRKG